MHPSALELPAWVIIIYYRQSWKIIVYNISEVMARKAFVNFCKNGNPIDKINHLKRDFTLIFLQDRKLP